MADDNMSATEHERALDREAHREAIEDEFGNDPDAQILAQADDPDKVRKAIRAQKEIARKAKAERDAYAAKIAEYEDRDKTEQQKLAERATQFERELQLERQAKMLLEVAVEKGLVGERAALASRLQGNTKEELAADADALLALLADRQETGFDGGARGTPPNAGGMDEHIRRALAARRG